MPEPITLTMGAYTEVLLVRDRLIASPDGSTVRDTEVVRARVSLLEAPAPVDAYVNAGEWRIARDLGGAE